MPDSRSCCFTLEPGGANHRIRAHVALGDQPAAAAETVKPALLLETRLVAGCGRWRRDLAAVAELIDLTGATIGTSQDKRHSYSTRMPGPGAQLLRLFPTRAPGKDLVGSRQRHTGDH